MDFECFTKPFPINPLIPEEPFVNPLPLVCALVAGAGISKPKDDEPAVGAKSGETDNEES